MRTRGFAYELSFASRIMATQRNKDFAKRNRTSGEQVAFSDGSDKRESRGQGTQAVGMSKVGMRTIPLPAPPIFVIKR
ncbi:MAG: hypothetical protein FWG18_03340 [Alphaproteobacteria bacterium]|nr:hypothetical protein [Alphaproteobacteria bacterium]